jgi:hypothetical protein
VFVIVTSSDISDCCRWTRLICSMLPMLSSKMMIQVHQEPCRDVASVGCIPPGYHEREQETAQQKRGLSRQGRSRKDSGGCSKQASKQVSLDYHGRTTPPGFCRDRLHGHSPDTYTHSAHAAIVAAHHAHIDGKGKKPLRWPYRC